MSAAHKPSPPEETAPRLKKTSGHWGRRQRRVRRIAWLLAILAIVALVAGFIVYRLSRPEVRRPGEKLENITETLSRGLPADAPRPDLTDVTSQVGLGDFRTFLGARSSQLPEDMGPGVAWGDFDNDGDDDLLLVGAGGTMTSGPDTWAPTTLYENLGQGAFAPVEGFPEIRILGMAAAWADFDGDGWADLAISGYRSLKLLRNRQGTLEETTALGDRDGYWSGLAWGDFDNDRDLDLYVCGYVQYVEDASSGRRVAEQYGTSVPYTLNPASFEPEPNLLFQNNGDGSFTEVAALYGVSNPEGRSLGALWQDFDDDGRLDLYVANDISDNALYMNRGETFEDSSLASLVADYRGAMGLATGDWNRDGDDDLFVTHWIAQENALYDSRLVDMQNTEAAPQTTIRLMFTDLAAPLGVGQIALQSVGWGTEFGDFDADGWLDLIVANGNTLETDTAPKGLKAQPDMLLWNRHGEYFHDLAPLVPALAQPHVSRGLALSDYDRDGDLDVVIADLYEGVRLLRNGMQTGNALQLRLRSRGPRGELTSAGEGAKVTVTVGDHRLRRTITGPSYLSQSSRTVHIGLGEAGGADAVEVRWLGGETQRFGRLAGNTLWELREGESEPQKIAPLGAAPASATTAATSQMSERERTLAFWDTQRAAMDAFKIDRDIPKATTLFRQALELHPEHEDSRYYLANCLAVQGQTEEAMAHLRKLTEINPLSHRAFKQLGVLQAMTAESPADLEAANQALERSLEINQEETGALLVLGEIALMLGDTASADQRFEWACRTNHRAVGGFYLRGYIAWKNGDPKASRQFLKAAQTARGEDWVPEGAVAEGDVAARMHKEVSPLSIYWERWDGTLDPAQAFSDLDAFLSPS